MSSASPTTATEAAEENHQVEQQGTQQLNEETSVAPETEIPATAVELVEQTAASSGADEARDHHEAAALSSLLLTKAKLFTVASEDGSWTEIGVGVVTIRVESDDDDDDEATTTANATDEEGGGTSAATAEEGGLSARMDVVSIEEDNEVLMSTPLVEDDIYVVQHGTILVWSDPEIGRDMALSFNTPEGCKTTTDAIIHFQQQRREAKRKAGGSATTNAAAPAASSATDVSRQETTPNAMRQTSGVSSEGGTDEQASPWAVCVANLPTIALALQNNVRRFGLHLREADRFAALITGLFRTCAEKGDDASQELISRIVVGLLGPPFNADGRILSQFIDNDVIDHTLDVVQYALGRRSAATGFVDAATRKAKFRNPCNLPAAVVTKIHVLQAAQSLKDLVPLLLDEGDAAGNSLLAVFLLRFKFGLVSDILRHDSCLPSAFACPDTHSDLHHMRTFVAFLHDVSKTIKNAMVPFDAKESLYEELFSCGVLEYSRRALGVLTNPHIFSLETAEAATDREDSSSEAPHLVAHKIVSMLCDVVAHMVMFFPKVRDTILEDANTPIMQSPTGGAAPSLTTPLLAADTLTSAVANATTAAGSLPATSMVAMRRCLWQRANFSRQDTATAEAPLSLLFTALMAHHQHSRSFLAVVVDAAIWASESGASMVAQSAYDLVYSCCIGLLQGSVYAAVGHNIQPKRRELVKFLVEGAADHKSPTSPTTAALPHGATTSTLATSLVSSNSTDSIKPATPGMMSATSSSDALVGGAAADEESRHYPPPAQLEWPILYRILFAIGNLASARGASPSDWTTVAAQRTSLHYLVRLVLPLTKDPIVLGSQGFPTLLSTSKALRTVRTMLETRPSSHSNSCVAQAPHGTAANVQATLMSWVAELVAVADPHINAALIHSGVMLPIVDLYVALHGKRRGGGCILGSSAANALGRVHSSIHQLKANVKSSTTVSPLVNSSFAHRGAAGSGNPFLRSIGKDGLDSSRTRSLAGDSSTVQAAADIDLSLVRHLISEREQVLRQSPYAAHKQLILDLEHVLNETPEEALEEFSSREASSAAVAATSISDKDFNALLAEYGPDAPVSDTVLREVVGDDVAHHHGDEEQHLRDSCSSSDHDEGSEDVEEENGSDGADGATEHVGFLLRREPTVRAKRSRSPTSSPPGDGANAEGASESLPPISSDSDEEDDGHEPAAKASRTE